jgi:hypothetical protein
MIVIGTLIGIEILLAFIFLFVGDINLDKGV